jgi:hypothetical protein
MHKQSFLPGFPDGAQKIGTWLSILEKEGSVTYFLGEDNYFSHPKGDKKSEQFALTSLMENGRAREAYCVVPGSSIFRRRPKTTAPCFDCAALWRMRIPTQSGRRFRFEAGQRSDLMSAAIPK